MSELAGQIRFGVSSFGNFASASYQRLALPKVSPEVFSIGFLICVLQIIDGLFTAIGVQHFGIDAEGNLLIRTLMELCGPNVALILVKSLAIAIVCILCTMAHRVRWILPALRGIALLYLCVAIVPWGAIIVTRIA